MLRRLSLWRRAVLGPDRSVPGSPRGFAGGEPTDEHEVHAMSSERVPWQGSAVEASRWGEKRAAGKLLAALDAALVGDAALRENLVVRHGLCLHRVRLGPDRRQLHVLWDAHPGQIDACTQALERNAHRLRAAMAKVAATRFTPRLEFRHDRLPPRASAAARVLDMEGAALERQDEGEAAGADKEAVMRAATALLEQQLKRQRPPPADDTKGG